VAVLVGAETVVLVLLVVLVAGLLRSHADILRALHSLGARVGDPDEAGSTARTSGSGARLPDPTRSRAGRRAPDLVGVTPDGETVGIGLGGADTLVAFLSSGCGTCAGFWQSLGQGAHRDIAPADVVVVTRDPAEESTSALLRLAPNGVRVVMSSAAWEAFSVPGSPYFVYVDGGTGAVTGEGTAARWDQLVSLCSQARADGRPGNNRVDDELMAAGIYPGHPSLYP